MQRSFYSLLALAAGLLATPAAAQINFGTYVSIGDSLAAGFSSGSLVESHQTNSVPALIARQAGASGFQLPLVSEPGIPAEYTLVSLSPVTIAPKSATSGTPKNLTLPRPYNNLAVPGTTIGDALTKLTDTGGMHDLILRGLGTQVAQAVALKPTFVTVWIGNNDVLRAALAGRALEGATLTPAATFRASYQQLIDTLKSQTSAKIVAANLPDVTTIPWVTAVAPYVVNPATGQPVLQNGQRVPLLGPNGPLPTGSYVLLSASQLLAQGHGVPTAFGGRGTALPDEVILDPAEVAAIRDRVNQNNQAIKEICGTAGVALVDVNGILKKVSTEGITIGGLTLTGRFLTGGTFSYDGVHPADLGYAYMANEWIKIINANGGSVPEINLAPFMGLALAGERTLTAPWVEMTPEAIEGIMAVFPPLDQR